MTEIALRLKDELLHLSEDDRVALARILWDSIEAPNEDDDAWINELDRRAADLAAGRAIAEPADKVFAELREECLRENQPR
jgi:putative addiction module component (TIGR02574 family)